MSVSAVVDEHTEQFAGLYPDPATEEIAAYLRDDLSHSLDDTDHIETALETSAARFFDTQSADAVLSMYEEIQLEDLERAEKNGVLPTYITEYLDVAFEAAVSDIDIDPEHEQELDITYNPADPGGRFDWEQQTVSIGWPATGTDFQNLLGVMYHELAHVEQFQDKMDTGVAEYNALLAASPVTGDDPVQINDPAYQRYGMLMQDRGETIHNIFAIAEDAYHANPERGDELSTYLQRAVADELAAMFPDAEKGTSLAGATITSPLFTLQDEAEAHVAYLEHTGCPMNAQDRQQYLREVEDRYSDGDTLRTEIEELL